MRTLKSGEIKYSDAERRKFMRGAKLLAELGKAGAIMYLAEDTLHLMTGQSHDDTRASGKRQDRIVETIRIPHSGGGDW